MTRAWRRGPRPLALHLAAAEAAWRRALFAWRHWDGDSESRDAILVKDLAKELENSDRARFAEALERSIEKRRQDFLRGVSVYRNHPYHRSLPEPPELWKQGSSRLLDYGKQARGRPVLLVPSLINRSYILDLMPQCSFARWLTSDGIGRFRPLLLDWGEPGEEERSFTLTDYVAGRLQEALDQVLTATGQRPFLLGYCMGGLLTLALAQQRTRDLAALVLLATPWDFHAAPGQAAFGRSALLTWSPLMDLLGELPVDILQALFATRDPLMAIRKFRRFGAMNPDSEPARRFVALEDWLNDGVALPAPVARECLGGWYADNSTLRGRWRIAGRVVQPDEVRLPVRCVIPAADRIVPPASAEALAARLPQASLQRPPLGHIGMMVSRRARRQVWAPLARWFLEQEER